VDLVLILLQPNQPPAADAHAHESEDAAQDDPGDPSSPSTTSQCREHSTPSGSNQENGQSKVAAPGSGTKLATEYGKEAKNFNREQSQREYMRRRRESRGEHGGCHECRVGRYGSWQAVHN